ncbi:unnamed protein product [Phytomonas sp. EM1]|nr:unnamed protein product [Phytomonas sp. EM1]|eukprot:CCW60927.1 unnamed protein product [Phytomonas sp. isolate EM1]
MSTESSMIASPSKKSFEKTLLSCDLSASGGMSILSQSQNKTKNEAAPHISKSVSMVNPLPFESGFVTDKLLDIAEKLCTVIPQGTWESLGSEIEIGIENATTVCRRPLITVQFEIPRRMLLQHHSAHHSFITKEASEDSRDLRGAPNPLYQVFRGEVDEGVQAVARRFDRAIQTHYAPRVNAAVQAVPTLVNAFIHHMELPSKEDSKLMSFLNFVLPRTLHCLTQNAEVPIYTDEYILFREDEAMMGGCDDLVLLEKGNYVHAATKNRRITSISWRSSRTKDDYICIASIAPHGLEERIAEQRLCESSYALVWELTDPMHPRYILEAPAEVQVLNFSPAFPNLIAGGGMNGQVYLWDLSLAKNASAEPQAPEASQSKYPSLFQEGLNLTLNESEGGSNSLYASDDAGFKGVGEVPPLPSSVEGVVWKKYGDLLVPQLQPIQSSRIEMSHRRPVHDMQWLPLNVEFAFDGKQVAVEQSHQFITISDDGCVYVWDTRPAHLPADKLRKIKHQAQSKGVHAAIWAPLLRYPLTRADGLGELMGLRVCVGGSIGGTFCVGTTDGELAACRMASQREQAHPSLGLAGRGPKEARVVQHVVGQAHAGPVACVQHHPLIADVCLTCGDFSFKVWRLGMDAPLYASPRLSSQVTCAAWSPVRAGIVFIGMGDGRIVVWDLLDRNNEPLLVHHLVQDAISVLTFKPLPVTRSRKSTQHIVIGTTLGSFHWYVLPKILSHAPKGEAHYVRTMLEREARRVAYYGWRWTERRIEMDRYGANLPKMLPMELWNATNVVLTMTQNGDFVVKEKPNPQTLTEAGRYDSDDSLYGGKFYNSNPERDDVLLDMVAAIRIKEEENLRDDSMNLATYN